MTETFEITVLADQPIATEGSWSDGQPYLASEEIERVLGWELKTERLCKTYIRSKSAVFDMSVCH